MPRKSSKTQPSIASRILRAVESFGSDDKNRFVLHGATVLPDWRVCATDGHRMIVVTPPAPALLPVGHIKDVAFARRALEVGAPVTATDGEGFPAIDRIIPRMGFVDRPAKIDAGAMHLNPAYLLDACRSLAFLGELYCGIRVTPGDESTPMRIDARTTDGIRATVVIMPIRSRETGRDGEPDAWRVEAETASAPKIAA